MGEKVRKDADHHEKQSVELRDATWKIDVLKRSKKSVRNAE